MKPDDVLSLGSRRRIYDFVRAHPGAHLREVARALEFPLGTALYHLDFLEREGLLVIRRDGRYKRFFLRNAVGRLEKEYLSAFHHEVPRRVVTALLQHGRRTQRELCAEIGVSRSTLSFHVSNLVEKGILRCEQLWPENHYSVAEPEVAAESLALYNPSPAPRVQAPRALMGSWGPSALVGTTATSPAASFSRLGV